MKIQEIKESMQDKGFILIAMVLIMLILAVTAISLSRQSGIRMRMSANRVDSAQNVLDVIAAQEEGFWQLTRDPFWWQTDDSSQTMNATNSSVTEYGDAIGLTVTSEQSERSHSIYYRYHLQDLREVIKPTGLCADLVGNLYFADPDRHTVYKVDLSSRQSTPVAGNGISGFSGDGGNATRASLYRPQGVAIDTTVKNLYIADTMNHRIRRVDLKSDPLEITTLAGNGTAGYYGDDGPAADAMLKQPHGIAIDGTGKNLYIADTMNHIIRRVDLKSNPPEITTLAGNGTAGYFGDDVPAADAMLKGPQGVSLDGSDTLYIADTLNHCIRKVDLTTETISTLAGIPEEPGYSKNDDGVPATDATLRSPQGIFYDGPNTLYIADTLNHCIRKMDLTTKTISTLAGNGTAGFYGDNGTASNAELDSPHGVFWSGSNVLFIADTMNSRLRRIAPPMDGTGSITTLFPREIRPWEGRGLNKPFHLALKDTQELYIADSENHRVRKMYLGNETVITLAGTGTPGYSGDGGQAVNATLNRPQGLAYDSEGDLLYIADTNNSAVRMVDLKSDPPNITTLAGNPEKEPGYSKDDDGGPATDATLNRPQGLAFDSAGDLYIADTENSLVRMVDLATNIITTVVGNPDKEPGYSKDDDGGPATGATLNTPVDVSLDRAGNIYIADQGNNRIRVVSAHNGYIYTLAGNDSQGYNGTGLPAVQADLNRPSGLAMADERGPRRIYVADTDNNRIRVLLYKPVPELY